MSGSGKGRIEVMGQKYLFDFESAYVPTEQKVKLAFQFPIIGEVLTEIKVTDAKSFEESRLMKILYREAKRREMSDADIQDLSSFARGTQRFLYQRLFGGQLCFGQENEKDQWSCEVPGMVKVTALAPNDSSSQVYFERLQIQEAKQQRTNLYLFFDSCDSEI